MTVVIVDMLDDWRLSVRCVSGVVHWSRWRIRRRTSNNRRIQTPTDRTVYIRLSTTLQLWRGTSFSGRTHITYHTVWCPRCLERLRLHLWMYADISPL